MATILVVDDEPANRLLVRTVAEHAGHEVCEAGDVEQAVAMARENRPSLVVVDLHLKESSGADLIKTLRSSAETRDVRIALYTATSDVPLLSDFMEAHRITSIVPKPAEPQLIKDALENALGTSDGF